MRSRVHVNILVYSNIGDKLTVFLLTWCLSFLLELCSNLDLMIKTNFSEVILLLFIAQSYPTLCDPVDAKASQSFTISWNLLKHISVESMMPSNHLILCHLLLLLPQSFPALESFPISWLFPSGGQKIGASASAFPMNIQGWYPSGLTGFISLLSNGQSFSAL